MEKNWLDDVSTVTPQQAADSSWLDGVSTRVGQQPSSGTTASDLAKSVKVGVQRLPGMVAGLADLPVALATGARPFTAAADALGEATGFQPGKWADETQFSAAHEQSKKAVDAAWQDGSAADIAKAYIANPGYTANQVAESLPGMVAGGLAGRALMGVGRVAAPAARAGGMGPGIPGLAERALGKWAAPVAGGVGEGAVTAGQQMAQYQGEDQQQNALASLGAGVGTGLIGIGAGRVANALGLETAETAIAKVGTGVAKAADEVPLSLKRRVLGGMVSEALLQELPQSAQEQMWSNWAQGKPLMEGVARAGTEGAIAGGVMGAGANLRGGRAQQQTDTQTEQQTDTQTGQQVQETPQLGYSPLAGTPTVFPDGSVALNSEAALAHRYAPQPVQRPSEAMGIDPSAGPLSKFAAMAVDSGTYMPPADLMQQAAPEEDPIVLQNRDRNSAASIAQMQEIASNPDYLRVGPSRDMTSGAPIVFGDLPPTAVLGRQELVVDGNGQRVGTQYAVVDAGDLIASNHADGSTVTEYATGVRGKLRSVAGNGRTAGLQAAYDRGTAGAYRQELLADVASIGVDAQALAGMQRPVLVRVMGQADVTADMGDRTNITGTQKLSPVEQAANDARRFDIANLAFDEGGNPTAKSIAGFVSSMPVSEQGDMMNPDGSPTRQAVDRLMAATFKQAYDSDELVQLYAQAADPDARAVLSAAADASGVMAALSGTEFDVRQAVADAVKMAVNASRQGLKLSDVLQNADFDMNPEAYPVATFLAQNIRSPKAMAEGLRRWGQLALQQARVAEENKYQGNLLGDPTPTLSRQEILARIGDAYNPTEQAVAGRAQPQEQQAQQEGMAAISGEPSAPVAQVGAAAQESRPRNWRTSMLGAVPVAKALGIEHKGKRLAQVVAEIDARDSENNQPLSQAQQAQAATENIAPDAGPFGPIFDGFENNPEGAIAKLMQEKRGEVPDAFTHPELGPIAFIYGDEGMGLRHIEAKRGIQWVRRIPAILRNGRLERDPKLPRAYLVQDSDPAGVAVIRLDWDGEQKTWLVTAHPDDKGKWSGVGKTSRTADNESGLVQGNPSQSIPQSDSATTSKAEQTITRADVEGASDAPKTIRTDTTDQTQTEAFKRWFADSKVVDATGKPLVMYHGTSGNEGGDAFTYFDAYASNYGLMGQGAYFTADPEVASSYTTKGKGTTPTVYKVFLSIQNPIDMDAKADPSKWRQQFDGIEDFHEGGDTNESWYRAAEDLLRDQGLPMWEGAETMQDGLRAMGFDGITHIGGGRVQSDGVRHRVYIAFEPEQVKSATGNNGNFDPANPDIRFSFAGQQAATADSLDFQAMRAAVLGSGVGSMSAEEARAIFALRRPARATKESVHAALRQLVGGLGLLPNRLGRVVVATAAEIKQDWEPLIGPTGMEASDAGEAQGFYDPKSKTVFLIADHINAGDELGVVAHELMHKHGQAVLGEEGWNQLHSAIEGWANAPDGSMEQQVYEEALDRVQASRPAGADVAGYSSQELFPYAVQVALEMGVKPNLLAKPGTVARWLGQVRAALRQVWEKITRKPEQFKAQDLVNLAFGIAQRENPEHRGELDGAISSMEREIRMVIDAARKPGGHAPQKAALGTVSDWLAREARDKADLDLAGFSHVLDGSAVRHIIKNHFDEKTERSRGQLPVTEADLQALPFVVARPDRVVFGTQNRLKRDQVAYVKRMPDGTILYLEEVRTGRAELAAVSLRKYPATMNVETIVSTLHPNAQGDGGNALIVLTPPDAGNRPMFSRSTAAVPAANDYTPAQRRAAEHAFGVQKKQTWAERAQSFRANLGTKLRQGLVDQFAPLKEVSDKAYMLARMSKGSDGAVEAALLYGKVFLRDGVYDVDIKDRGFAKVLATLKGEDVRFFQWVAAQRAERLKAEGKENLLTDQDITALKSLNAGRFADGTPRMGVYAQALKELNAFNDSTLKVAMESGLIDQAAYDLMKDQPYVPFYRLMEDDGGMRGPRFSSGLVNQQAWKKLKGGTQQLNADLLQNTLMNWSHLYAAAARNRASLETMAAAEKLGIAYRVSADTKGAVKVMRDGVAEHWAVEDPYLLDAISAMSYTPPGIVKAMAPFKRLLTFGVTVNPTFKIRNLIRDSLSAIAQSDLSYNPAENVAKGWKATSKNSQTYASMLASGGIIKFGTQEDTNRVRAQIEKLGDQVLDKSGFERFKGQMKSLWEVYEEFGDRTENVNRAALYERLIAKGHSHAEASFMARDLMDFSMSGKWETVRFLAQTVPFLNARLQGLYKLGRAAKEDPRRFAAMAGAVSLASLGLLAAYGDDEDWKKREDWDRDNFWWFKVGDKAFRIPKPFEVGAIGTLAERTAELMLSDEMTGKRFGQRISDMVFNTFAMDPTPQAIKPFLDVYANKDSFSGRAIEGMADERLRPQDRYNERTSEVARLLGSWGLPDPVRLAKGEYQGLSPKQIDFLLRGYFGWLATVSTTTTDMLSRPLLDRGERPAMRLRDTFLAGNFVESLPTGSSRYVTAMYEQAKEVDQAWASHQAAIKSGDIELARSIQEEEGPKLRNRFAVANAKQQIAELGQQAKKIEGNRLMSAEVKRQRLDEIEARKNVIAQRVAVTH